MTTYRNCTLDACRQVDDEITPHSDNPALQVLIDGVVHQAGIPDSTSNVEDGRSVVASTYTNTNATMAAAFDRLTRLLEQQDRDIRDLRERLDAKDRELHDVLVTLAAKGHAVDQSQERIGALDQELTAAHSWVAVLEEKLPGLDNGSEVATIVDAPVMRIRARAAGFHDGNFFELEIGGDRDLYTLQRGIHVTILRRGVDDEATRNLCNEMRTAIANKLGSTRSWDLKWRGGLALIAKFGDPKVTVESVAVTQQGPTEWVGMEN
ncbi:hypothetical protein AMAG_12096 [Allomyces macrogynus ATCC 38327]|uniref:Uncharacterized protein n=1 Tax=Allomyces macrogynus (strain ATCC 38327) TaxID=578462 RepID=A0A0L0SZA0_ALLM3|nr:hypothetical protein AMAG_12096 [Allomyces macrogynus ATCC 38327]|eukprot:KNE67644.1 hypothetical protein AMAG_12096 [Allomyces macrogynus ATCC 38327]